MVKNFLLACMLSLLLFGCADSPDNIESSSSLETTPIHIDDGGNVSFDEDDVTKEADSTVDYDITALSSTMVYGQMADLMYNPDSYTDKTFKITGVLEILSHEDLPEDIYVLVIYDALGCCPQGIEIRFSDIATVPEVNTEITIIGTAQTGELQQIFFPYIEVTSIENV